MLSEGASAYESALRKDIYKGKKKILNGKIKFTWGRAWHGMG